MSARLVVLFAAIVLAIAASSAAAQGTLGNVAGVSGPVSCPPNRNFATGTVCYTASLTGCPTVGTSGIQFYYGVLAAVGSPIQGTIVFLAGGGGTTASDALDQNPLLIRYSQANYQVVQIAWGYPNPQDWEETYVETPSVLAAACLPATFLNWVRNGTVPMTGTSIWNGMGGMCSQGHSAGSGALGYALAWYNAGAATATNGAGYLDKAVFTSGPVFSDLERGCEVPNNQYTIMCTGTGQVGCVGWPAEDPPGSELEYLSDHRGQINTWSGATGPSCANNSLNGTTTYNQSWLNMSILAPPINGQQASFNYPNTALSAWLCQTTAPGTPMNNTGAQGELFWDQFTNLSQAGNSLTVNAVSSCPSAEDAISGTVNFTGDLGSDDIFKDMTDPNHLGIGCTGRHSAR